MQVSDAHRTTPCHAVPEHSELLISASQSFLCCSQSGGPDAHCGALPTWLPALAPFIPCASACCPQLATELHLSNMPLCHHTEDIAASALMSYPPPPGLPPPLPSLKHRRTVWLQAGVRVVQCSACQYPWMSTSSIFHKAASRSQTQGWHMRPQTGICKILQSWMCRPWLAQWQGCGWQMLLMRRLPCVSGSS